MQFPWIAVVLFLSTALSFGAGYVNWRREEEQRLLSFVVLMGLVAAWSFTYGVQLLFSTLSMQVFWDSVQYIPGFLTPVAFVVFVVSYTGHGQLLTRRRITAVAALPVVTGTVVWVPGLSWLVREGASPADVGSFVVADITHGPLFKVSLVYGYLCVAVGLVILVVTVLRAPAPFRAQAGLIATGAVVPIGGSLLSYVIGSTLIDLTPVALSVFGLSVAVALARFQLLDVRPIASDRIVSEVSDGILITDDSGQIIDANPAAERILGTDITLGADLSTLDSCHVDGLVNIDPDSTSEIVCDGGQAEYVQVRKSTIEGLSGGTSAHLHILRDVTDQRARERWFRALTEHASDVVLVLDSDLRVTYVSPSVERILGYDPSAMNGDPWLEYLHDDSVEEVQSELFSMDHDPAEVTIRARTADGDWRTLRAKGTDLLDDPVVEGIVVNAQDITESQERKRELLRQNERLDEFASVVSHDLRNPLSVASGHLEMIAEDADDKHVETIRDSHVRMEEIIEDLLTLARSGQMIDAAESVDIENIAREAWGQVETYEATLEVARSCRVDADAGRLQQLFENLFRNAVEHGDEDVCVTVRSTPKGFAVDDDGPGIPTEDRESVFESGYTTDPDGTGVGLAIVQAVADGHEWSVKIRESPSGGARFAFEI